MASFSKKFNVANASIEDDANWTALDSIDGTADVITIVGNAAGAASGAHSAVAWYIGAVPASAQQEIGARITGAVEATTSYIDVGLLGQKDTDTLSAIHLGIWARFYYLASGARRLAIYRYLPDDAASAVVMQANLVLAGGVESESYRGLLNDVGSLGTPQLLRLVVTPTDTGYRARAFINSQGDETPVLDAAIDGDFVDTSDPDAAFGRWWIGFGPSGAVHGVEAAFVYGLDYDASDDHAQQDVRPDQISLAELRDRVRNRYTRGVPTALSDTLVDQSIRDAIDGVINSLQLGAAFLWREESVDLATDTSTGRATLTTIMRDVMTISDQYGNPVNWRLVSYSASGAPIVVVDGITGTYLISYVMRHSLPTAPDDRCPIPREHSESVVLGACYRIAMGEPRGDLARDLMAEYELALGRLKSAMTRQVNATRPVMAVPMQPQNYGLQRPWSRL